MVSLLFYRRKRLTAKAAPKIVTLMQDVPFTEFKTKMGQPALDRLKVFAGVHPPYDEYDLPQLLDYDENFISTLIIL
ncbi:hypothetical protein NHX12_019955 [Muraenolepis orangiensis]|uniref:Uncharacterized protein n=1 Tax=Muraenolepis orangiensis TaxID=630683 RepID=A0A9Q0EUJ3_9TELE|nr:hypothetical protein NHX12_019955 [Muraenolepis orangiensis]